LIYWHYFDFKESVAKLNFSNGSRFSSSWAADDLSEDYPSDKELTAFTNLDFENFYETR
jgi:hypothetical protein